MGSRPQLQIAEAIVESFPVAMMDLLIRKQRASQVLRHYEAMFGNPPIPVGQILKLFRNWEVPIAVVNVSLPSRDPNWLVGAGIAGRKYTLVVGLTESSCFVRSLAPFHRADSGGVVQRASSDSSRSKPSLIMTMAISPRFGSFAADLDQTNRSICRGSWRSSVVIRQVSSVVHFA